MNSAGACVGCMYVKKGKEFKEDGPVILTTGGFGADFSDTSLVCPKHKQQRTTTSTITTNSNKTTTTATTMLRTLLCWPSTGPTSCTCPGMPQITCFKSQQQANNNM
ncbi:unnamed protein product [Polarella glacialis]|uniref:Uncharacterized protein n=1 Tax=Polarella glacialis TaxID=89957 RepID=A0A813JVV9_POLGL|nr:unnamed protein product [Polarella glacialis]